MIRELPWNSIREQFNDAYPFNHIVIDNFFDEEVALKLSEEFPAYNDPKINNHNSPLENKRTCNTWDRFPPCTYRAFMKFGSNDFLHEMQILCDSYSLVFDYGLNGGGWHMHSRGGNNNIHLDYNLHPKMKMQRKLNIIVYLTQDWNPEWGGGLELWSDRNNKPDKCEKVVDNIFNRAIIFDTTQCSWHGLPNSINCPEGVIRKSLAAYYLQPAPAKTETRYRALFAPRPEQKDDMSVQELIRKRASISESATVYNTNK